MNTPLKLEDLTPAQRAAVALLAMGRPLASEVLKHLAASDVEQLATAIAHLRLIPAELGEEALAQCAAMFHEKRFMLEGGYEIARGLLESSLGDSLTRAALSRLDGVLRPAGFRRLQNVEPRQLLDFLRNEHPQTIALILTQTHAPVAAAVLSELPAELQSDVALRIAALDRISPEVLDRLEAFLDAQFDATTRGDVSVSGGARQIAEILNLVDTPAEKRILRAVGDVDSELATRIRKLMFAFEDVVRLDDRSIQRLLMEVSTHDLTVALRGASAEVKNRILGNLSERVAGVIQEEIEYLGPMRISDVEAAQQSVVETLRRLEEEGQIIGTPRGAKNDVVI